MSLSDRQATVLVVDDQHDTAASFQELLRDAGRHCLRAGSFREAIDIVDETFVDLLVLDERLGSASGLALLKECRQRLPGIVAILVTGHANVRMTVQAMRSGALDLLEKPVAATALLESVGRVLDESAGNRRLRFQRWSAQHSRGFPQIIGQSPALLRTLDLVRQVGPAGASVLIQGESGTGKELIAKAIHASSPRRDKAFVDINAGALPPTLLETTLFGSVRGAYTDSKVDRPGLFEAAHAGTLFLDEIGEATLETQVRLLRVLEEKMIVRVGDVKPIPVDVRVVAATNRDLIAQCRDKSFREDLYYRLAVMTITLPPLRERIEDMALLATHFLEKHAVGMHKPARRFSSAALERLRAYRWPGNIRELENVVQRAVILTDSDTVEPDSIVVEPIRAVGLDGMLDTPYRDALALFQRHYFARLLERAGGNKTKAAEMAGIDRTALYDHLKPIR